MAEMGSGCGDRWEWSLEASINKLPTKENLINRGIQLNDEEKLCCF